jgi:hypothetical protein
MSTTGRENRTTPLDFQGPSWTHRTRRKTSGSTSLRTLAPSESISGFRTVKEKRELFPGSTPASPSSFTSPFLVPPSGSGMLTGFPFDRGANGSRSFETEFPYLLGSTDPCPTAVTTEPFSTSVFEDLARIFATTTKICTGGGSTRRRRRGFFTTSTPAYSSTRQPSDVDGEVWVTRLSAIHFQG